MPYDRVTQLPASVKDNLSKHAQEISYNNGRWRRKQQ